MAIGKGSLQRAASAAKNAANVKESGAAENAVNVKESGTAENAVNVKESGTAENAVNAKKTGAAENAVNVKESGAAKNAVNVKKSGAVKKTVGEERELSAKVTREKKSSAAKRSIVRKQEPQEMWLATVKAEQLCVIPDEWRGPKYVRPNVSMLAESISRCGILEPLPVVQIGIENYQLVGGSRRMEVVKMLGISEVPVVVLPGTTLEDAHRYYNEMKPYTDAAQDTMHNAKFRTAALFGAQRIPEYLL